MQWNVSKTPASENFAFDCTQRSGWKSKDSASFDGPLLLCIVADLQPMRPLWWKEQLFTARRSRWNDDQGTNRIDRSGISPSTFAAARYSAERSCRLVVEIRRLAHSNFIPGHQWNQHHHWTTRSQDGRNGRRCNSCNQEANIQEEAQQIFSP